MYSAQWNAKVSCVANRTKCLRALSKKLTEYLIHLKEYLEKEINAHISNGTCVHLHSFSIYFLIFQVKCCWFWCGWLLQNGLLNPYSIFGLLISIKCLPPFIYLKLFRHIWNRSLLVSSPGPLAHEGLCHNIGASGVWRKFWVHDALAPKLTYLSNRLSWNMKSVAELPADLWSPLMPPKWGLWCSSITNYDWFTKLAWLIYTHTFLDELEYGHCSWVMALNRQAKIRFV